MDTLELRFCRRLQRTLLAILFLVVVYVAAPSIYTKTLSLMPSPTGHSPQRVYHDPAHSSAIILPVVDEHQEQQETEAR